MDTEKLTRRVFAKHVATVTSAAFLMPGFTVNIISKPALSDEVIGHGDFRYRVHKDWGTLDPGTTPVNNCHEMVQDAQGRLIMIGDEVKNNILIYDKSGKLLDTWGSEFPYGHGLKEQRRILERQRGASAGIDANDTQPGGGGS